MDNKSRFYAVAMLFLLTAPAVFAHPFDNFSLTMRSECERQGAAYQSTSLPLPASPNSASAWQCGDALGLFAAAGDDAPSGYVRHVMTTQGRFQLPAAADLAARLQQFCKGRPAVDFKEEQRGADTKILTATCAVGGLLYSMQAALSPHDLELEVKWQKQ